jgi:hypothetical protein
MLGFFAIWAIFAAGCFLVVPDHDGDSSIDRFFRAAGYAFAIAIICLILSRVFGFDALEYSDRFSS